MDNNLLIVILMVLLAVQWNDSTQSLQDFDAVLPKITHKRTKRDTVYQEVVIGPGVGLRKQEQDTEPNITCPSVPTTFYADQAKTTVSVTWNPATASDHNSMSLRVVQTEGQLPGSIHSEGKHTITYLTRDSDGRVAFCSKTFSVIVRRCPFQHTYLENGNFTCEPGTPKAIYGSKCSYSCRTGFQLVGASTATCQSNSTWNVSKPSCKAVTCGSPNAVERGTLACSSISYDYNTQCVVSCDVGYTITDQKDQFICQANKQWTKPGECQVIHCPELQPPEKSAMSCTDNNTYNSVCTMSCLQPYDLEGEATRRCQSNGSWTGTQPQCLIKCEAPGPIENGQFVCENGFKYQDVCTLQCDPGFSALDPLTIRCELNKTWSQAGICEDSEAPTFPYGCPNDMDVIAASLGNPTYVNYPSLKVSDNSGKSVRIDWQPSSGSQFYLGRTNVSITATDTSGNRNTCHFTVNVRAISCQDPELNTSLLRYTCPDGHVYGATCDVTCARGYTHGGAASVRCDQVSDNNNHSHWVWSGSDAPYCNDFCSPGQNSVTGRRPCQLCPKGSYQSKFNMTNCDLCPYGMSTFFLGATSDLDCQFFDVFHQPLLIFPEHLEVTGRVTSCSMVFWMKLVPVQEKLGGLKFALDESKAESLPSIYIYLDVLKFYIIQTNTKEYGSVRKWYHISLTYQTVGSNSIMKLYVNGILTSSRDNVGALYLYQRSFGLYGDPLSLFVFETNAVYITGMQLTLSVLSEEEIKEFATTCFKRLENNLLKPSSFDTDSVNPSECNAKDDCANDPCSQHGICIDWGHNFTCYCDKNWEGERCESPHNYCINHQCANGATCVNNLEHSNYTCSCTDDFTGALCTAQSVVDIGWGQWGPWSSCSTSCGLGQRIRERQCDSLYRGSKADLCPDTNIEEQGCFGYGCPVDGGFGEWSAWSPCSVTCGGGVSSRKRYCDNPAPSNGGLDCDKSQAENLLECSSKPCPVCSNPLSRQGHESFVCTEQDKYKECEITCKPGLALVPNTVNTFLCGLLTNYTWSHVTQENPTGILPDCSDQKRPLKSEVFVNFTFANASCMTNSSGKEFVTSMKENLQQRVSCLQTMNCSLLLSSISSCGNTSNKDQGSVQGTMVIEFLTNTEMKYLSSMTEKERAEEISLAEDAIDIIVQMTTSPNDSLTLTMNDTSYIGTVSLAEAIFQCQDGAGFYNGLCVDCPPGSYYAGNGMCEICEQGFYQDKPKMHSCEKCPECTTTAGLGSYSLDQCQTDSDLCGVTVSPNEGSDSDVPLSTILLVLGVVVALIILLAVAITIFRCKQRKKNPNHPYNIPEARDDDKDEDPYARIPADDPYDNIDEEVGSNGYLTVLAPDDAGISNGTVYDQPDDQSENQSYSDLKAQKTAEVFNDQLGNGQVNFAYSENENIKLSEKKLTDRLPEFNTPDSELKLKEESDFRTLKEMEDEDYIQPVIEKDKMPEDFESQLTDHDDVPESTDEHSDWTSHPQQAQELNSPRSHQDRKTKLKGTFDDAPESLIEDNDWSSCPQQAHEMNSPRPHQKRKTALMETSGKNENQTQCSNDDYISPL